MSRLANQLRLINIHNNHNLLTEFGDASHAAIEYRCPPPGRLGWCESKRTRVWSPRYNPKLPIVDNGFQKVSEKVFLGKRSESLPAAIAWVQENLGDRYATSPFGGLIPSEVLLKAQAAVRANKARMST